MLNFIGIGGAFEIDLYNCSAYIKDYNTFILIDCGENIFEQILRNNLLSGINKIIIILTHFHTDHVGSLGSLIFYCDKLGIKDIKIIYPNLKKLRLLIDLYGLNYCNIKLCMPTELKDFFIQEFVQKHSRMEAYGYLFNYNSKTIYYSGDTKTLPNEILEMFLENKIDYFYHDIRKDENNYHISIKELSDLIPESYRKKIYCMHFNSIDEIEEIKNNGFSLVKRSK